MTAKFTVNVNDLKEKGFVQDPQNNWVLGDLKFNPQGELQVKHLESRDVEASLQALSLPHSRKAVNSVVGSKLPDNLVF